MERRRTVSVDEALLARARSILGTSGVKDTINAALREIIRADQRRRFAERIRRPDGFDDAAVLEARERNRRSGD